MKMVKCQQNVTGVESGRIFLKSADLRKIEEKLSSWAVFENEEQLAITLEGVVHLDNEGVTNVFL